VEKQIGAFPDEIQKVNDRVYNLSQSIDGTVGGVRSEVVALREEMAAMAKPPPAPPILEAAPEGPSTEELIAASGGGGEYVIKSGDTFGKIAKNNNTTSSAIQDANPGVDPTKLKIGQKIRLP
jgi:LysM repeat protein